MRMWHGATEEFESPTALKARLVESFPDDVPDNLSFQIGYFHGKSSAKHWIVERRDLQTICTHCLMKVQK